MLTLSPETEQYLQWFILAAGILVIPVTFAVLMVLIKLSFLIHSTQECLTIARYELSPLIKELQRTVDNVQEISERTSSGIKGLSDGFRDSKSTLNEAVERVKVGASSLLTGVTRSFWSR